MIAGKPPLPRTLTPGARAAWADYCEVLSHRGQLGVDSAPALELLSETQAEVDELQDDVARRGRFYVTSTRSGEVVERRRPQYVALRDANRRLLGLLAEFGLTLASRSRISLAPPGP